MALPEGAARAPASEPSLLHQLLSREGRIIAICVALLCALAWWWLWRMANMMPAAMDSAGMASMDMPMDMPMAAVDVWTAPYLGFAFAMWAIMMVAMMLPSVSPLILLHAAFSRRSGMPPTATLGFAVAYLLVWTGFAAIAAIGQAFMVSHDVAAEATLRLGDRTIAAALLALMALYQLSGLKRLCLANCRSPVAFLMRHWKPGMGGALRMGAVHGLYCIGCCGLLMLLLFVGGVMNLAWVALLTLLVLAEKYAPARLHASALIATMLLAGSAAIWIWW